MRVVLQRVRRASVVVDGETIAEIGRGYLLLAGVRKGDPVDQPDRLAEKIVNLRLFADDQGKTNRSLADVDGEVLVDSVANDRDVVAQALNLGVLDLDVMQRPIVRFHHFRERLSVDLRNTLGACQDARVVAEPDGCLNVLFLHRIPELRF